MWDDGRYDVGGHGDEEIALALHTGMYGSPTDIMRYADRMIGTAPRPARESRYESIKAEALRRQGRRGEALERLAEAVRLDPANAAAWRRRGRLLEDGGDAAGALECYENAERHAGGGELGPALAGKARALHGLGRHAECLEAAGAAVMEIPDNAEAHALRAVSLLHMGRAAEAAEAALEAPGRDGGGPGGGMLEAAVAEAMAEGGDHAGALGAANRSIRAWPRNPGAWYVKARMLARTGRAEPALDALTVAVSLGPGLAAGAAGCADFGPVRGTERFARVTGAPAP